MAASKVLGPPSIFIVHSSKSDADVKYNWARLFEDVTYDGIIVENVTETYGVSYLSVFLNLVKISNYCKISDFHDGNGYGDLWTASQSNDSYIEYYLSRFDYTLVKVDSVPDACTGLIEVLYRTDSFRRNRLVSDGGFIEIKVSFDTGVNQSYGYISVYNFCKRWGTRWPEGWPCL